MMALETDAFGPHMEAAARALLGEPNKGLSSRNELRFGSNGSLSVDLEKGCWRDHENEVGGGVLSLVTRETGRKGQEAVSWLRDTLGADIPDNRAQRPSQPAQRARIAASYDYVDESGEVILQVCRMDPKDFRQRRPDPAAPGGWNWSVKGVRSIPYRLPELLTAIAAGDMVFVVEGEKDVDALYREGVAATCNAGGAGKWPESFATFLKGADVVILPDNDLAGLNHAQIVAQTLRGSAARVRSLTLPDLPLKGDVSDWLSMGGDGKTLRAMADEHAKPFTADRPASSFGAVLWSDLDTVAIRQDWLVEDMMFCGDAALMFGASGSGKSFLTVELGLSIARGVPFLGKPTRKGAVIYQAGEGGKGLVKRLRAYRQENHVSEDVPFVLLPTRADLFSHDGAQDALIAECKALKGYLSDPLALVVIDTLSTASPGANENASEDMSRLLQFSERMQRETGAGILWVHHKNAAGERERGHSSLRSNVDTALEVIRDEETKSRTLRVVKVKDGEDGEKIGFELQSVEIGTYDDGKPMTSCVVRPAQVEDPQTGDRFRTKLTSAQRVFLSSLDSAISQYGGVLPPNAGPTDAYAVEWPHFSRLYKTIRGHDLNDNALRQSLMRDGDALHAKGMIGRANPWIWVTQAGHEALIGRGR